MDVGNFGLDNRVAYLELKKQFLILTFSTSGVCLATSVDVVCDLTLAHEFFK
jgi:hypothetical protein